MSRIGRMLAAGSVVVVMVGVGLASPAVAGNGVGPHCGTTITADTTLLSDLGPCPDTAIRFGADNITLNLNGHKVFGDTAVDCDCPGVYVPNRRNVRIVGGTVSNFASGIYLEGGGGHLISGVVARDNIGPLDGDSIFGEGIQLFESHNNRILNSQMLRNGTFSGINLYDSGSNTLQNNLVQGNDIVQRSAVHGGPTIQQDIGIWIISLSAAGLSRSNVVSTNSVTQSGLDGIQVSRFSVLNTVERNTVASNGFGQVPNIRDGDGIAVFGINNLFQSNTVVRNAANGIGVRAPGTQVGPGNRMIRNNTSANNAGPNPSAAFDLFDASPSCTPNTWSGNTGITFSPPCTKNP